MALDPFSHSYRVRISGVLIATTADCYTVDILMDFIAVRSMTGTHTSMGISADMLPTVEAIAAYAALPLPVAHPEFEVMPAHGQVPSADTDPARLRAAIPHEVGPASAVAASMAAVLRVAEAADMVPDTKPLAHERGPSRIWRAPERIVNHDAGTI